MTRIKPPGELQRGETWASRHARKAAALAAGRSSQQSKSLRSPAVFARANLALGEWTAPGSGKICGCGAGASLPFFRRSSHKQGLTAPACHLPECSDLAALALCPVGHHHLRLRSCARRAARSLRDRSGGRGRVSPAVPARGHPVGTPGQRGARAGGASGRAVGEDPGARGRHHPSHAPGPRGGCPPRGLSMAASVGAPRLSGPAVAAHLVAGQGERCRDDADPRP